MRAVAFGGGWLGRRGSGARGRRRRRGGGGLRPRRPAAAARVGTLEESRIAARARARADARAHAHLAALRWVELALAHLLARAHKLDAVAPAILRPGLGEVRGRVKNRVRVRVSGQGQWSGLGLGLGPRPGRGRPLARATVSSMRPPW